MRRFDDRRAIVLSPPDDESIGTLADVPLDFDRSLFGGQGSVLDSVGGEFVKRHSSASRQWR